MMLRIAVDANVNMGSKNDDKWTLLFPRFKVLNTVNKTVNGVYSVSRKLTFYPCFQSVATVSDSL